MQNKILIAALLCALLAFTAAAQKIEKPTLTPVPATPSQTQLINEGIALHDAGKYSEAMKRYEQVLAENANCDQALYELALSAYYDKNYTKALETSYKLIKYKSNTAIAGYGILANTLDDQGKPNDAIEIYKNAIKQLSDEKGMEGHLSSLHYNLGLTLFNQHREPESRDALKKAVLYNFGYASPDSLLSRVFFNGKYRVPALLAAMRFVSLELNSPRTATAVALIKSMIKAPEKDAKGAFTINLDFGVPADEGDFGAMEIILGTVMVADDDDKGPTKTESEKFADAIGTIVGILGEQKKLKSTFVGKSYVPFMAEMKAKNHLQTFANVVLWQGGNEEARTWLNSHKQQLNDFWEWSRTYKPPV